MSVLEIPLVRGGVTLIDAASEPLLSGRPWRHLVTKDGRHYAQRTDPGNVASYLHRLILGAPRGTQVDHIDGDGLNNTRINLRLASASLNGANRGPTKGRRYKGITPGKRAGSWLAMITVNRRTRSLGVFESQEDAAKAYDVAALEAWGEFAYQNLPKGI